MSEQIDPMELDDEEYKKQLSVMLSPEEAEAEPATEETAESTEEVQPVTEEVQQVEGTTETNEELFEIVYKGETKKLTRDKMKELAQKGFSYHADMNRIAPHKKIVALIEEDEEIGKLVNDYVTERAKPKTSKLTDFNTEEEWLEDNLKRQKKAEKFAQVKTKPPGQEIIEFFQDKDPENYEKVLGALGDHANQLTMAEYQRVNSDMGALEEFYETVKGKVLGTSEIVKPKQTFRARSGGGAPPRPDPTKQKAWELSSKDFNKMIQSVKGY